LLHFYTVFILDFIMLLILYIHQLQRIFCEFMVSLIRVSVLLSYVPVKSPS
jgi:hypothetical protein